jgi:phosphate/sulfate permease
MISATFFGLPASTTQITGEAAVKVEKHLEAEMLEFAILSKVAYKYVGRAAPKRM